MTEDLRPDPVADRLRALIVFGRDREAAVLGAAGTTTPRPTPPSQGASMEPLEQLGRLGPVLGTVIANITPDDLAKPTPCAGFDVRGVLAHMVGGATGFAAAFRGEPAPSAEIPDDVLGALPEALGRLFEAIGRPGALDRTIAAPFGSVPGDTFARFVVLDGLVHGWDMARATGQRYDPPADLVADVTAFAESAIDPLRDGETFAAATTPPAGASPMDRLAAFTGRAA